MKDNLTHRTQRLVVLAQGGDPAALNQLYEVYAGRVHWLVRLRMGRELRSKLESMDVVQDVLVYAMRDLGKFVYENEGDFLRWLAQVAENRIRDSLDRWHARKRDMRKEVRLDIQGPATGRGSVGMPGPLEMTTPSVIISKREDLERLERAIEALKSEYREVIVLTKIEGLSYEDIAQRLGKSKEAVRKLAARALAELSNTFESD